MALTKRTYENGKTPITAENLNEIQDEIIRQGTDLGNKAPAGKSLVFADSHINGNADFDKVTAIGMYWVNTWVSSGGNNLPYGKDTGILIVYAYPNSTSFVVQEYHSYNYPGCVLKRTHKDDGDIWTPWEWVNPPMKLGVEYRTTERWNGNAVYTKLIDCGKMPNNTQVAIPHGISMDKVIRHCGYGGTSTIPYSTTVWTPTATTHSVDVAVSTYAIYIRTNYDASAESAMIQLWYTKD